MAAKNIGLFRDIEHVLVQIAIVMLFLKQFIWKALSNHICFLSLKDSKEVKVLEIFENN